MISLLALKSNKNMIFTIISISYFLITLMLVSVYPGSPRVYITFNLIYLFIFLIGFYGKFSWVYFFLSGFWLLAYPIKVGLKLLNQVVYVEPVGLFDYGGDAYNDALSVAIFGALGLALSKIFLAGHGSQLIFARNLKSKSGSALEIWLYLVALFIASFGNFVLKIFQVGIMSQVVLPFKLTAMVFWMFNLGFPVWLSFILWRTKCARSQCINKLFLLTLASGFLISCSLLSRSPFIFIVAPMCIILIVIARTTSVITSRSIVVYLFLFFIAILSSLILVSELRRVAYTEILSQSVSIHDENSNRALPELRVVPKQRTESEDRSVYLSQIKGLFVDRWVGFEGVAAVSAYHERGWDLFVEASLEPASKGSHGLYQHIAESPFIKMTESDAAVFSLGFLPGIVAFAYYSGHLWFVTIFVFFVVALMLLIENIAKRVGGRNIYFTVFVSISCAHLVLQFSNPIMHVKSIISLAITLLCIWVVMRVRNSNFMLRDVRNHE
jgi:hypothetical protein